jgi:hypothetical protein
MKVRATSRTRGSRRRPGHVHAAARCGSTARRSVGCPGCHADRRPVDRHPALRRPPATRRVLPTRSRRCSRRSYALRSTSVRKPFDLGRCLVRADSGRWDRSTRPPVPPAPSSAGPCSRWDRQAFGCTPVLYRLDLPSRDARPPECRSDQGRLVLHVGWGDAGVDPSLRLRSCEHRRWGLPVTLAVADETEVRARASRKHEPHAAEVRAVLPAAQAWVEQVLLGGRPRRGGPHEVGTRSRNGPCPPKDVDQLDR